MHFESLNAFQIDKRYLFPDKNNIMPTLPKIVRSVTRNALIFLLGLIEYVIYSYYIAFCVSKIK